MCAITGCETGSLQTDQGGATGFVNRSKWEKVLAPTNLATLEQYTNEWQFNRYGRTDRPPQLGLALSGGGMRSGNFCIGVLNGLDKLGILTNIDIISSVSGGGYAASWYYTQTLNKSGNTNSIFDDNAKYQRYLLGHGELMSHAAPRPFLYRWGEYLAVEGPATICSIPLNFLVNGLFGCHLNVSPVRHIYQNGIDRIYQVVPNNAGKRSFMDWTRTADYMPLVNFFAQKGAADYSLWQNTARHLDFETLGKESRGHLPFPIVNTTAYIESPIDYADHQLRNRVFEFTPFHYGSDYYGYADYYGHDHDFPVDYNKAISISAAAVDTSSFQVAPGSTASWIESALNFNFGYYIRNPSRITNTVIWSKFIPLPFYPFFGHYQKDVEGNYTYLDDGDFSENLGAYSVIRRLCKTIIIVDAGYDPANQFSDYELLKKALLAEKGVDFSVPDIDHGPLGTNSWNKPVMSGTISYFPFPMPNQFDMPEKFEINVIYIKMSLDTGRLCQYPNDVESYYWTTTHDKDVSLGFANFGRSSIFPHRVIEDLSYYPDEIQAFHELGCYCVTNNANCFTNLEGFHQPIP